MKDLIFIVPKKERPKENMKNTRQLVLIYRTRIFFVILHDMLAKRVEVSDIHCIKDAKGPQKHLWYQSHGAFTLNPQFSFFDSHGCRSL
ncbi:hypothetical protein LXL04_005438 [Taraxacum kok-saghyz]